MPDADHPDRDLPPDPPRGNFTGTRDPRWLARVPACLTSMRMIDEEVYAHSFTSPLSDPPLSESPLGDLHVDNFDAPLPSPTPAPGVVFTDRRILTIGLEGPGWVATAIPYREIRRWSITVTPDAAGLEQVHFAYLLSDSQWEHLRCDSLDSAQKIAAAVDFALYP